MGVMLLTLTMFMFVSCSYDTDEFYKKYDNNSNYIIKTDISNYPYITDTINNIQYKSIYISRTIDFKNSVNFCKNLSNDYKIKFNGKFSKVFIKIYVKPLNKYYNEIVCWVGDDKNKDSGETIITYYGIFDDIFVDEFIRNIEFIEKILNSTEKTNNSKSNNLNYSNQSNI